jgi:hypothetical protein
MDELLRAERGQIVQLIPASNWHAAYKNDDLAQPVYCRRLLAWALWTDGTVCGMDSDEHGVVHAANDVSNFSHYEWIELGNEL